MTDLSPTQRRILEAASKQSKPDIREHMLDIKSPAIRDKVLQSMLKHGLVVEDPNIDGVAYLVSKVGFAAVGEKAAAMPIASTRKENHKLEKPARTGKKEIIIALLRRGATLAQLVDATAWQKHSVHGALANLKTKDSLAITSMKANGGERVYKIA